MKKTLMFAAVMVLGLTLTTPALAKHRDPYRGHRVRGARGGYHTVYYAPYSYAPRPKHQTRLFFGFGLPLFAPVPVYYYAPAPLMVPGPYARVWVPGHYVYEGGTRFWIAGSWSIGR